MFCVGVYVVVCDCVSSVILLYVIPAAWWLSFFRQIDTSVIGEKHTLYRVLFIANELFPVIYIENGSRKTGCCYALQLSEGIWMRKLDKKISYNHWGTMGSSECKRLPQQSNWGIFDKNSLENSVEGRVPSSYLRDTSAFGEKHC